VFKSLLDYLKPNWLHPLRLPHALLYGKFTTRYLWTLDKIAAHSPRPITDYIAHTYHGKVVRLEDARKLVSAHSEVEARNLERVIPYRHARDLILKSPDHILAYQCPCRALRKNPCCPTDVCLVVGEPFVDGLSLLQPRRSRRISQGEAVAIIEAEEERGHIHTAWFKDVLLDRFYVICNCCKCCCTGMRALKDYGIPMVAPSGYVPQVSQGCTGCGVCAQLCPFGAMGMNGDRAEVARERCFGCGLCQSHCPPAAITLQRDPDKGEPLDIDYIAGSLQT